MLSEGDFAPFARWRVGAFGRKLREVCDDEAYDDMTFEDKIGMRADAEIEARDSREIDKAVRTARFKLKGACVEDICHLPDRSVTRDRIARLATRARAGARESLVIISESGGGKSCIAQALGVAARRKLVSVRYARLNDMFREPSVARSEGRVYDALDRFARPDLLVLGDFFTTPIESPLNAVDLFEILEAPGGARLDDVRLAARARPMVPEDQLRAVRRLDTEPRRGAREGPRRQGAEHARVHREPQGGVG